MNVHHEFIYLNGSNTPKNATKSFHKSDVGNNICKKNTLELIDNSKKFQKFLKFTS